MYSAVTNDIYELPIVVPGTARSVADQLGVTYHDIWAMSNKPVSRGEYKIICFKMSGK